MSYTTSVGMLDEVRKRSDAGCDLFYRTYRPLVRMHGRAASPKPTSTIWCRS